MNNIKNNVFHHPLFFAKIRNSSDITKSQCAILCTLTFINEYVKLAFFKAYQRISIVRCAL